MKISLQIITLALLASLANAMGTRPPDPVPHEGNVLVSNLELEGEIKGENIVFSLKFDAEIRKKGASLPIVIGDTAYLDGEMPRNAELRREGNSYFIKFNDDGKASVSMRFASRAEKKDDWRLTNFNIPSAAIKKLSIVCDRDDLEVKFTSALDVKRHKNKEGKTIVTAFLGLTNQFAVAWKPEVKKLEAELAVACDANTVVSASVGALEMDSIFTFRIVQGSLKQLSFKLPGDINVTQVSGEDIQDWTIENDKKDERSLQVTLRRERESDYNIRIQSETALPEFPCKMLLPVITPENVIRNSGFLMIGTDSAIKLVVNKAVGLTQVDQTSFPQINIKEKDQPARPLPTRSKFAYQYANMPYTLELAADDIVPEYSAENQLVLSIKDNDLVFTGRINLDVRDAPARDIKVKIDPEWIVANVEGASLSDYDVISKDKERFIHLFFREAALGRALINIRLEQTLKKDNSTITAPSFSIQNAKSERGFLIVAAEKGLQLTGLKTTGLRDVHTGSVDMRVEGARKAFRFKEKGWALSASLEHTKPTVHSELLHLISIREGILYISSAITYHISGAPVRDFKLHIPEQYQNVEFTGKGVRNWKRNNNTWTVSLQEKILGDFTLLVTCDQQFAYEGENVDVGGIQTIGTTSEAGYIVMASSASLNLTRTRKDETLIPVDKNEIPSAYSLLINDPVLQAYKYTLSPHTANINIKRYDTERLLDQVADHISISTLISEDGEAVTTARYSIKNLARQYFVLSLPDGAKLWSTHISSGETSTQPDEQQSASQSAIEQETMQAVKSMQQGEATLIPIGRHRNPNLPVKVKVVYAQNKNALGTMGGTLKFTAPKIKESQSTFTEWRFTAPTGYALSGGAGGNMVSQSRKWSRGLLSILKDVWGIFIIGINKFTSIVIFVLAAAATACLWSYSAGKRKGLLWQAPLGILMLAILFAVTVGLQLFHGLHGINDMINIVAPGATQPGVTVFTSTLSLAQGEPLATEVKATPSWLGAGGSFGISLFFSILGIATIGLSRRSHDGSSRVALGLMLLTWGLSYVYTGKIILLAVLCGGVPLFALGKLIKLLYRRGKANRVTLKKNDKIPSEQFEPYMPPPFEPDTGENNETTGLEPESDESSSSRSGKALPCLLLTLFGASLALSAPVAVQQRQQVEQLPQTPVMNSVNISIDAPEMDEDSKKSAAVKATYVFETDKPSSFIILRPPAVLSGSEPDSKNLEISATPAGYILKASRRGEYSVMLEYSLPVKEHNGTWSISFGLPENLRNKVALRIPGRELEVESEQAVLFETTEEKEHTVTEAAYGTARSATLVWKPRARKTGLEKVAFFCDMNSVATFQPGVVEVVSLIRYQIAQGELKSTTLQAPEGMNVTSVQAAGLSTWRFDPETGELEAALEKAVTGEFTLMVVSQAPCEGLPYEITLGAFKVKDALRLRGVLALASLDTVQIQTGKVQGLNPMNIEDVSQHAVNTAAKRIKHSRQSMEVKRAFRYHRLPIAVTVTGKQVLPEIRVNERSSLSLSSERALLSTVLNVNITKAGVFSLTLALPKDYEVESLTGQDVSHWDELTDNSDSSQRTLIVHFKSKAIGKRNLNIEVARTEKGINDQITAPKVSVSKAVKHEGVFIVSAERGVRMSTIKREGVSEVNPRDLGIRQTGVLSFRLLRPEWKVTLKTEVVDPLIRSEVLQKVDISEGMLKGNVYIQYRIDHAGVKTFRLQSPEPGVPLAITGKDIAKVTLIDKEKGVWEVELHSKRQNTYSLHAQYQISNTDKVLPLKTLDVESQKGHVAVFSSGRARIKPASHPKGLKHENFMAIPNYFGAGDMSDAIYCYRAIGSDYMLELSVIRHDSAAVIPAKVTDAQLTSVVSGDGQLLTKMQMNVVVGDLRFLEITLPHENTTLWSSFVNGAAATVSHEKDIYRIPLDETLPGEPTAVEIIYAGKARSSILLGKTRFEAPIIHRLPMNDVKWDFYVVPDRRYHGFDGTMEHREPKKRQSGQIMFQASDYRGWNARLMESKTKKGKEILSKGEMYARKGQPMLARKAMESAVNYSQSDVAFNEDARVQFRNLAQQQALVGLVQRRDEMRFSRNISDKEQMERMQEFHEGQFTADYARRVQQSLPEEENATLMLLAGKLMDQQAAAEKVSQAIEVAMPTRGRKLSFYRKLHIDPEKKMTVVFKTSTGRFLNFVLTIIGAIALYVLYRHILRPWSKQHL